MKHVMMSMGLVMAVSFAMPTFAAPTADNASDMATNCKIEVVDVGAILQSSAQANQAKTDLKAQFGKRAKDLDAQQQQLQTLKDNFKKNQLTMNQSDRSAMQDKISATEQKLINDEKQFEHDFETARNGQMTKILGQMKSAIAAVAAKNGDTLILDTHTVLYADDSLDVTDEVKTAFESAAPSSPSTAGQTTDNASDANQTNTDDVSGS